MKAWLFQRKKGKGNPWSVGWYDQTGKRKEKKIGKRTLAERFRQSKESELAECLTGYIERSWSDFRVEYEHDKLSGLSAETGMAYRIALNHFEAICKPKNVAAITTKTIDAYVAKRRNARGRTPSSTLSAATINKELRAIKRVLNVAVRWKYLRELPAIEFVREHDTAPTFVSAEEFNAVYAACDQATRPTEYHYGPTEWWRAFLLFQFMTGWRMSEPLRLLREDLDLENGIATSRAADNKGKREARIPLHPIVVDHLRQISGFTPEVFPWPQDRRSLWTEFQRIQKAAGVNKTCRKQHPHNESCKYYGFHDLRRGFATANADQLSASQLQQMMRHSSYATTQLYINMAAQLTTVTDRLQVPSLDIRTDSKDIVA